MALRKTNLSNSYTAHNRVKLIRGGQDYFKTLINLIDKAKESIHIQMYIYADDETGQWVTEALLKAVKKNVKVYLMADGYASQSLSNSFIEKMKNEGVQFRFFEPIFKSKHFYFGRRLHQKLVVVDQTYALVGGVNIANHYNDLPEKPAWLDFALLVEGEVVLHLCLLCWKTWKGFPLKIDNNPCEKKALFLSGFTENNSLVRMRRNDRVRGKNEISASYIEMLRTAKSDITILCSYFLPGKLIRNQINAAIKRGVKIRIIAAGSSDVMLAKFAERWLYNWMLRVGVELYEYQENILHGKVAVCDDHWMTIGSYNINNISAYASIELNLDVHSDEFTKEVREKIDAIIQGSCIRIIPKDFIKTNSIYKKIGRWLSYHFIRFVLYLFTFYFTKQR